MAKLYDVFVKTPTKNLFDVFTYKSDNVLEIGSLVKIIFSGRETYGIIYQKRNQTHLPLSKINEIKKVLGTKKIIHERAFALAKWMSIFYAAPVGEVLFAMLPIPEIARELEEPLGWRNNIASPNNIHISGSFPDRLVQYTNQITSQISQNKQVLLLFPNYRLVDYTTRYFSEVLGAELVSEISDRLGRKQMRNKIKWLQNNKTKLAIGTRKSIFLPFRNLSTIIIDQPANYGYFNDQKPAYTPTRIAWKLSKLFNIKLILGDNLPDLESIYYARRGKLQLKNSRNKNSVKLIWQISPHDDAIKNLSSNLNLIITPYLDALGNNDDYSVAATNIASHNIKQNHAIVSSHDRNFKLPPDRPFSIIATKKIIDYPELIFDKVIILGADLWLSLPSYDATQDFVTLVWQIWQQTKNTLVIQSSRPIPLIEKLLGQRPGKSLAQFMQARQKFNLPPYRCEIIIKTKHPDGIIKLLPEDSHPVTSASDVTAYFKPQSWPPQNINDLYQKSDKILVDPPR